MGEAGGENSGRPRDLWPWYKEVLSVVEAAIVERQPGARPRLERILRIGEQDFKNLLRNPQPSPHDADLIKKATTEGIKLPGSDAVTKLSSSLVEEALIVSDLFQLNELSSLLLLLHGEEQLPQYPSLTRGLVAVLLYYDGRKALVQALRTLISGRPGLTWCTDTQPDISELVQSTASVLMVAGLTDSILILLSSLDWTVDVAALQKHAALGDPQHIHTVSSLHLDIRQGLADCLYCYSAQSGLPSKSVIRILEYLSKVSVTTAMGCLDGITMALVMAVLASMEQGEEQPLVTEPAFIPSVSRELEGRNRKWETPGILSLLQLTWATTLASLRQSTNNSSINSTSLEEDELFVELAMEGRVFHCLPSLVLASQAFKKEEFYIRRLHGILTDFLSLMSLKIKELRNRADDAARNALMHEQEGIQYTVPLAGQHFGQLLATLAILYKGDPLNLGLADLYWCPTDGISDQGRRSPAKQVALYKFVRLAGDLLMPSLFVPYINMLTGLSDSQNSAPHCFKLLKQNGSGSSNVCLDHFFQSLSQYHGNLQHSSRQGMTEHTIYRTAQPLTKGISPQEVAGLGAVLDLATVLADRSETARIAMAEHPGWSVVPTVMGLLACSVPTTIKARLVHLLAALTKSPDIVHPMWAALEGAGLVVGGGARPSLVSELEEVEARAEEFPLTRAFLTLLDRLTDTEIPGGLGAGTRAPGFQPYLSFLQDSIFLKFQTRTYRDPGEKWEVAALCLELLHKLVVEYDPKPEDFQGAGPGLGLSPGFHILCHLHQTSQLLRTLLYVLDEARCLLDTFSPFLGKERLEAAATAALGLLQTSLSASENFISCGRTAGTSTVLTSLSQLLLGINPRSGKPDHLLTISRFIQFGYWLPSARLAAVKIISLVAASRANQPAILATFTDTEAQAKAVLKSFTEALDSEEDDTKDDSTRLAVLELLHSGTNMPAPSLAHFLLGFDLKKGVSRCQLQSAQVTGVRTPLHALLDLLAPCQPGQPPRTAITAPVLLTAAYRLIYSLVSTPCTSEPVLRYLRSSSDFLSSQLACVTVLLEPGTVQAQRSTAWLLRALAVEVRMLARHRQTGQLAKILGLLLDTVEDTDFDLGTVSGIYQDSTFSQLSRTVAHSTSRQGEAASSVHRLAVLLNNITFEMETLSAPTWELFDDNQVAGVLEQCQRGNQESCSHELLIDIPKLHRILSAELSAIQGSAAASQRAMIQTEIESILSYAVRWNSVQESAAAKRDLLDAWRQVTETLITVIPGHLLPQAGKQQILLHLLQSLLNKVSGENRIPGMDSLVSSTVLLLLTALRSTYTAAPERKDIMGETFVGILDVTASDNGSGQTYSASLQVVLRGLISWLLTSGAGSQSIRTNLYAALLSYLRIGKADHGSGGAVLELSERGRLQQANLEVVQTYGINLLEVLARDATTGHDVRRMLALAVLEELVGLDRQANTIRFLSCQGFLKHLVESLSGDQSGLTELLTKPGGNVRYLYVFEAKLGLLVRTASHPAGAELLLQAGLMARLGELSLLSLRPDLDTALLGQGEVESVQRYHAVLFPVLRLCLAVMASLGGENVSGCGQVLQFLTGHQETVSLILRGSAARSSLHPALLQELALLTAVVSRAAALDIRPEQMDAASIELCGQQARLQRQMLALIPQFQLNESLLSSVSASTSYPTLYILQIISNAVAFARSLVSASSSNSRSCRLVVTPSFLEDAQGPASARPASIGLLVASVRRVTAQLSRSDNQLTEAKNRLASLPALPLTELTSLAQVSPNDKLPAATVRKLAQDQVTQSISGKETEVSLCSSIVEGLTFLLWRHLEHFLLYSTPATTSGPNTPFQAAFSRLNTVPTELGSVPILAKAGFTQDDLDRLKSDAPVSLNEAFFDKLTETVDTQEKTGGGSRDASGFLESILRRTQRLTALHTQ